ncbi:MAG: 50S ribosomal protein L3 [Bacteroidota bacterium]
MVGIIGKKVGMTTLYDTRGASVPCTVITSGPCVVTQIKSQEKDGYCAIQLAYDERKEKNTPKPLKKHFEKAQTSPKKKLVEFSVPSEEVAQQFQLGQTLTLPDVLAEGDYVDATGYAKGKGFQGVVKRHGFSGVGQKTHGQHNRQRAPGSIGASSFPSRVFKGMRMGGRAGGQRVKVANLKVMKVIPEHHLLLLSGAVPGSKNAYIILAP